MDTKAKWTLIIARDRDEETDCDEWSRMMSEAAAVLGIHETDGTSHAHDGNFYHHRVLLVVGDMCAIKRLCPREWSTRRAWIVIGESRSDALGHLEYEESECTSDIVACHTSEEALALAKLRPDRLSKKARRNASTATVARWTRPIALPRIGAYYRGGNSTGAIITAATTATATTIPVTGACARNIDTHKHRILVVGVARNDMRNIEKERRRLSTQIARIGALGLDIVECSCPGSEDVLVQEASDSALVVFVNRTCAVDAPDVPRVMALLARGVTSPCRIVCESVASTARLLPSIEECPSGIAPVHRVHYDSVPAFCASLMTENRAWSSNPCFCGCCQSWLDKQQQQQYGANDGHGNRDSHNTSHTNECDKKFQHYLRAKQPRSLDIIAFPTARQRMQAWASPWSDRLTAHVLYHRGQLCVEAYLRSYRYRVPFRCHSYDSPEDAKKKGIALADAGAEAIVFLYRCPHVALSALANHPQRPALWWWNTEQMTVPNTRIHARAVVLLGIGIIDYSRENISLAHRFNVLPCTRKDGTASPIATISTTATESCGSRCKWDETSGSGCPWSVLVSPCARPDYVAGAPNRGNHALMIGGLGPYRRSALTRIGGMSQTKIRAVCETLGDAKREDLSRCRGLLNLHAGDPSNRTTSHGVTEDIRLHEAISIGTPILASHTSETSVERVSDALYQSATGDINDTDCPSVNDSQLRYDVSAISVDNQRRDASRYKSGSCCSFVDQPLLYDAPRSVARALAVGGDSSKNHAGPNAVKPITLSGDDCGRIGNVNIVNNAHHGNRNCNCDCDYDCDCDCEYDHDHDHDREYDYKSKEDEGKHDRECKYGWAHEPKHKRRQYTSQQQQSLTNGIDLLHRHIRFARDDRSIAFILDDGETTTTTTTTAIIGDAANSLGMLGSIKTTTEKIEPISHGCDVPDFGGDQKPVGYRPALCFYGSPHRGIRSTLATEAMSSVISLPLFDPVTLRAARSVDASSLREFRQALCVDLRKFRNDGCDFPDDDGDDDDGDCDFDDDGDANANRNTNLDNHNTVGGDKCGSHRDFDGSDGDCNIASILADTSTSTNAGKGIKTRAFAEKNNNYDKTGPNLTAEILQPWAPMTRGIW